MVTKDIKEVNVLRVGTKTPSMSAKEIKERYPSVGRRVRGHSRQLRTRPLEGGEDVRLRYLVKFVLDKIPVPTLEHELQMSRLGAAWLAGMLYGKTMEEILEHGIPEANASTKPAIAVDGEFERAINKAFQGKKEKEI